MFPDFFRGTKHGFSVRPLNTKIKGRHSDALAELDKEAGEELYFAYDYTPVSEGPGYVRVPTLESLKKEFRTNLTNPRYVAVSIPTVVTELESETVVATQ